MSCSVGRRLCSVCGTDRHEQSCGHIKGRSYGGKVCADVLDMPTDAYEWSFVAVPAQAEAGVTKHFSEVSADADTRALERELAREREISERACDMLKREIISLSFMTRPIMAVETVKALTERLGFDELCAMRDRLKAQSAQSEDEGAELFGLKPEKGNDNAQFAVR